MRGDPYIDCNRIAAGLYKRATALVQRKLAQQNGTLNGQVAPAPVPEQRVAPAPGQAQTPAPAHTETPQGIPAHHIVLIQGKPFVRYAGLLQRAHAQGLQELRAEWTYNDAGLSLAHAVAVFPFGRFEESGDATPDNVSRKVAPHFRRVALTRALARCLRHALNVDLVAVEELADE